MKNSNNQKHVSSMAALSAKICHQNAQDVTEIDLDTLTMKELLKRYNGLAKTLGYDPVKRFTNKAVGATRLTQLMEAFKKVAPANKPTPEAKVDPKPTSKKTKKSKKVEKPVGAKKPVSLKRYSFGKHVSAADVKAMVHEAFNGTLVATNVEFVDNHYWYADIKLKKSVKVAEKVRVDYLVNYLRIPRAFKEERSLLLNHTTQAYSEK